MTRRPVVLFTRGAPGSGKTTWAREAASSVTAGRVKLVSLDDMRRTIDRGMAFEQGLDREDEALVRAVHDEVVYRAVRMGRDVIVHNTHAHPSTPSRIRRTIACEADVAIVDFSQVPIEQCLSRDDGREYAVGPDVVRKIHAQVVENRRRFSSWRIISPEDATAWLSVRPRAVDLSVTQDPTKPEAVIVDLDGTLAIHQGRNPYDGAACGTDALNIQVARAAAGQPNVVLCSGRSDEHRQVTLDWLDRTTKQAVADGLVSDGQRDALMRAPLFMRAAKDMRPDSLVKLDMFTEKVSPDYRVTAVIDDRQSTVRMWRLLGIPCWQVDEGEF